MPRPQQQAGLRLAAWPIFRVDEITALCDQVRQRRRKLLVKVCGCGVEIHHADGDAVVVIGVNKETPRPCSPGRVT